MARKPGTFTSRTKARKRAADVIFEAEQRGMRGDTAFLQDLLDQRMLLTAAETPLPPYSVQIVQGVVAELTQIDRLLEKRAKVEGLDRLPAVDLAVLRVAVWEMIGNRDEVDPVVAIDEAVAIVKSISTDASPGFVNAVLDSIKDDLATPWGRQSADDSSESDAETPSTASDASPEQDESWDDLLDEY